ncbi:nesprin-3 isoform X6 [Ahaetulla prasina]|uniref:nesprin-3 isoform X6 n=1 Tax=Ahaetulla prasina TaxID=499056 RepID=UPI0026494D92|nr:nesprin-3 isoform X6 [Ahaetulla prasina]
MGAARVVPSKRFPRRGPPKWKKRATATPKPPSPHLLPFAPGNLIWPRATDRHGSRKRRRGHGRDGETAAARKCWKASETRSDDSSSNAMIQQLQNEFDSSVEKAEDWMKTIQERLRINDNTKGPRSALEARLRDTEKICALEPEGRLKMDLVLMKADALLQCISEEQKHEILSRLKDVKAMWEETAIYITHCHSRIEWVWLHWSEYLKAQDEFYTWLHNMKVTLEPDIELQLGLKEKQWQLSHAEVLLKDVQNRSSLLDRLLDEAVSLYNRIGDASVDEEAREKMKEEYEEIKNEAERRVMLLEKITTEHKLYKTNVDQFRLWLTQLTERLNCCLNQESKLPAENRIKALQDITKDVRSGEKKWKHLEAQSIDVMQNTSPLGAEKMNAELEELKKLLENIKLVSVEEEEKLLKSLQSENTYHTQARMLEIDVQEFRKRLQRLGNHFEKDDVVRSDEDLISLWREYMATKANLTAEESKAEKLKIQLKELFKFSQDLQPLSESVIHAIREHQSLKGKMFKLSTEIETELRQRFQNPLREFQLWKPSAQRLLDTTAHVSDPALTDAFLRQIEIFLVESSHLKEQLLKVQMKKDFLGNIFKQETAKSLLEKVSDATEELENLHKGLLQRKSRLQIMIAQSKQHIQKHWTFNDKLSDLQQWLIVTKQKLEYYCDATTHNAILDLERLQTEFPGREIQLHLIEAHGHLVIKDTSPEGAVNIQAEMKKLKDSFKFLENLMSRTAVDVNKKITCLENMRVEKVDEHLRRKVARGEDTNELQLIKNFEQWLQRENNKLSKILALNPSNNEEVEARYSKIKELQLRVPEGQYHFEELLHLQPAGRNWDELEELRYQWMLYKSKLKDSNNILMTSYFKEPNPFRKARPVSACSFLRRVCCAALPLQLLLLLLLLLAFLLPLAEETHSCKLTNNFAHSFNLMLRHDRPPPI